MVGLIVRVVAIYDLEWYYTLFSNEILITLSYHVDIFDTVAITQ